MEGRNLWTVPPVKLDPLDGAGDLVQPIRLDLLAELTGAPHFIADDAVVLELHVVYEARATVIRESKGNRVHFKPFLV